MDECSCGPCNGEGPHVPSCPTCGWEYEPCPCADLCDTMFCECRTEHVKANPQPTCFCAKCPNIVGWDNSFCDLCRETMQVSLISLRPAKAYFVCVRCHYTTTMEDS